MKSRSYWQDAQKTNTKGDLHLIDVRNSNALRATVLIIVVTFGWFGVSCDEARAESPTGLAYYVRSDGDDSNDGLSDATAWRTVAKVNRSVNTVGADVYFKSGSVLQGEALVVDWSGTAQDRAVIGSYYLNGKVAEVLEPDDPAVAPNSYLYSNGSRAEIRGTYTTTTYPKAATCAGERSCVHDESGATPPTRYDALVTIRGSYVTVQDLRITNSAGLGLNIPRIAQQQPGWQHVTLQRNYIDRTYGGAISIQDAQYFLLSGNLHDNGGLREFEIPENANPASIGIRRDGSTELNLYGVVENNDIRRMNGEGINYIGPYVIVRGNRIGNLGSRPCIYAHTGNTAIEYNICYGGQVTGEAATAGAGIKVFVEDFDRQIHVPLTSFVIRGNMISGTGTGIAVGAEPLSIADGLQFAGMIYNNSIIQSDTAVDLHWLTAANFADGGIEMKNNVFFGSGKQCGAPASNGNKLVANHNLWFERPPDVCSGTGDVFGNPGVAGTGFTTKTFKSPPTPSDYVPNPNSPARRMGTPLDSTVHDLTLYRQSSAVSYPCARFDTAESDIDAICNPRDGQQPAVGALEGDVATPGLGFRLSVE